MNDTTMQGAAHQHREQAITLTNGAIQAATRILEAHAAAARDIVNAQKAIPWPFGGADATALLEQQTRYTELFKSGAQHAMALMRHGHETLSQVESQLGVCAERQATQFTDRLIETMKELTQNVETSMRDAREGSFRSMDEAAPAAKAAEEVVAATADAAAKSPIIVSTGLEGTRSPSQPEPRSKAPAKR